MGTPALVPPLQGPETARAAVPPRRRTSRRRLVLDRAARFVVTAGGVVIIASILGILLFIVHEVVPLARPARVATGSVQALSDGEPRAVLTDEYRELIAVADAGGRVRVIRLADGATVAETALLPGAIDVPPGGRAFVATGASRVVVQRVGFEATFTEGKRSVGATFPPPVAIDLSDTGKHIVRAAAQVSADGESTTVAVATDDGVLVVDRETATTNAMTGAVARESSRASGPIPQGAVALVLDEGQSNLFAGFADGRLAWWRLGSAEALAAPVLSPPGPAITAMTLLIGDRSLVAGRVDGSVEIRFVQRGLPKAHVFPKRGAAVVSLAPSPRGKGFAVLDASDRVALLYATSERTLWQGASPVPRATTVAYAPKADGIVVAGPGRAAVLAVDAPHPEVSLHALLGKIWYEGYEKPEYVWQSSSGTEDFEPKLSLTPLLFGTLKGTIYSLLLAVPLGVLSAMYASQFLHPSLQRVVKPVVEIMASLPSVVLGFLAGLWLAPVLERVLPALVVMTVVLPLSIVLAGFGWERIRRRFGMRPPAGSEVFFFVAVLALSGAVCLELGRAIETGLLGGSFPSWLLSVAGIRYDQRNAIVVGLAMGFAVIPIIFAIAEDAFSNVPKNLVSGSLALGATRWQTVTRVVLPTASPGIFAAIMVGFGRAVGETMIVLMATGNTPIMDWSPFDGFRTLSANIAVEIAEAPQGGTLYRTLFLAALLLFMLTFLVNTAAELVRQRLRRKYASL
ncbi:MAG TPA: ABC transporter permease subunit [Candidatus Polarisedimenticolaceae bacterium]|nr:ABC transporter permease subunit [Candidatus Polarisedimenticolaceae bacterium]